MQTRFSIPTDCCQRDERLGWLADAHISTEEAINNFDMLEFYRNWIDTIASDQGENGNIPDFVPDCDQEDGFPTVICDRSWTRPADPTWGTALIHTLYYVLREYGDIEMVAKHYDNVVAYIQNISSFLDPKTNLVMFGEFGDWYAVFKCDTTLVSAFYYHEDIRLLAEFATVLGRTPDAKKYSALAQQIKQSYNRVFFNSSTGFYITSSPGQQTANSIPIFAGIVDPKYKDLAVAKLVQTIQQGQEVNGTYYYPNSITSGIVGTKHVFPVLVANGYPELAFQMVSQKTYPGWGYMVENGATTLWEHWNYEYEPQESSSHK